MQKEEKLKQILSLIKEYTEDNTKTWTPGKDWVHYAGTYFDSNEYVAATKSLLDGWLVLGKEGTKFERRFSKYYQKPHGILTNSGSSSNLLMMLALTSRKLQNFQKGTKVITPIAGFPTTVNPIFQVGFEPIFIDIEVDTLNLDLDKLEEACAKNPDAKIITFAHVLGNPPNMKKVMEIVEKYNLILLEDCCDALGSMYEDKPLGSFGEMASCSFYPAHHITMGEGGFVAVSSSEQEKAVRSFRDWGRGCYCTGKKASVSPCGACGSRFSCWIEEMPDEIFDHKYIYEEIGYNLKPIELQAAMGLAQLDKLEDIGQKRRTNFLKLRKIFDKYEDFFHLPRPTENSDPSWFAFPLTIRDGAPFKRSMLTNFYESNKIQTRSYFAGNIMLQPAYKHLVDTQKIKKDYPVATKVTTDTFFLGTSPVITDDQIKYIGYITDKFFKGLKR